MLFCKDLEKEPKPRYISPMRFSILLLPLLLSGFLISCGKTFTSEQNSARGSVSVLILNNKSSESLVNEDNPFEFQVVELLNIFDLTTLTGKYVQFYTKASNEGGKLDGEQPKLQFLKTKKGYFVAKNNFSMELASLYFHTQNLARIDEKIGATKINSIPRKIIVDTPITEGSMKDNNAIYDAKMDVIVYLPYTESHLTLAMNGGIFAHEYFHSLFHKLIQKKVETNPLFKEENSANKSALSLVAHSPKIALKYFSSEEILKKLSSLEKVSDNNFEPQTIQDYYVFLLKGLNEGLADFWGWSYTKDVNFIKHSLPEVKNSRCLDLKLQNLSSPALYTREDLLALVLQPFSNETDKLSFISSFSYAVGTRFALFFKELTTTISLKRNIPLDEAKIQVMKSLITFMTALGTEFETKELHTEKKDFLSAQDLVLKFAQHFNFSHKEECQVALASYMSDLHNLNTYTCSASEKEFKLTKINTENSHD